MSERTYYERPETIRGHKYIRLKSGRLVTFWDMVTEAEQRMTDVSRALSRALKLATDEWDLERVEARLDDMEDYVAAVREAIEKQHGVRTRAERIARLRNTTGRTPEEAELFRRKADELERRGAADGDL